METGAVLDCGDELGAAPIDGIRNHPREGNLVSLSQFMEHLDRKLGLAHEGSLLGEGAFPATEGVVIGKPLLGDEQPRIKQGVAMGGGIASEHAHLAVLHLADGATVLFPHTDGVIALFDEAGFIEDKDPMGIAEVIGYHAMIGMHDFCFVPDDVTHEMLHGSDISFFYGEGDGFDRFPFYVAELTDHVSEEMVSGFAPSKTVSERFVESFEFPMEIFNVFFVEVTLRYIVQIVMVSNLG
jgi:hypothetical protein